MRIGRGFVIVAASAIFAVTVAACQHGPSLGPDEIPLQIAQRCPGDKSCPAGGDDVLYAGAAKRDITPTVETFTDVNGNNLWDEGEPFVDVNGNGRFDPVWMSGRDNGRLAMGVHDPVWVRAWVLRQNAITIAFYSIDCLGLFIGDNELVRAALDPALGVDLVVSSSTHDHQNGDVNGQWGPDVFHRGVDEDWLASVRAQIVAAITEAVGSARPAKLTVGSIRVEDADGSLLRYVSDTRDPVVIDNRMHVLQLDGHDDGKPIVTVVDWAAHPDSLGKWNRLISSDFVHYVRDEAEKGTGDDVVYVTGAVGGQIGSGRVQVTDAAGATVMQGSAGYDFTEAWGRGVADFVGRALDPARGGSVVVETPKLAFRTTRFAVHVDNVQFQTAFDIGLFGPRMPFGYDKDKPITPDNTPAVETEMAYIQLGPHTSIITIPGEMLPESFVGGYDGSDAGSWTFLDTTKANTPDMATAPKPPYLRDVMDGDDEHRMVFGLSLDFLGYIVPRYNFVLDPVAPYLKQAAGDHYEETNGIGVRAEPEIIGTARQLVLDGRPNVAR